MEKGSQITMSEKADSQGKFEVRLDPDAIKEYNNLDNSVTVIVNKAIDELETRADEVGKTLGKKHFSNLTGCKEIKLRNAGIRIVFRVTNEIIDTLKVVYILAIEQRSKHNVFKIAGGRLDKIKNIPKSEIKDELSKGKKWQLMCVIKVYFFVFATTHNSLINGYTVDKTDTTTDLRMA